MSKVRIVAVFVLMALCITPAEATGENRVWLPLVMTNQVHHCRRCVTLPVEP